MPLSVLMKTKKRGSEQSHKTLKSYDNGIVIVESSSFRVTILSLEQATLLF